VTPARSEEVLIATPLQLRELVSHVRAAVRFGLDTEFVSEETFEPVLCLIQVATRNRLAVIDPLAVQDLGPFWDLLHDPSLQVVMHAAGEDMRICLLRTGKVPGRIFDVQIAAGLVGYSYPLSLRNLVSQVLRISLPGSETRTDWRRRPLSQAQLRYALDDVRYLLPLADHIEAELKQLRRTEWAEEEFADFLGAIENRAEQERWRRLTGLNQLSRRGLEAARRLFHWREDEARRLNRPMRQIIRDDLLVAIAKRQPSSRRDLEALRDFNRPALLSKGEAILAVLDSARAVPDGQLPEHRQRPDDGPGASTVANLLAAALGQLCAASKVAGSLAANVSDLKNLIRWYTDGRPDHDRPALLEGWRGEHCGKLLLEILEGRRTFRVVDPASEFPVALEPDDPPPSGSPADQFQSSVRP
jgi:ribonuclease D